MTIAERVQKYCDSRVRCSECKYEQIMLCKFPEIETVECCQERVIKMERRKELLEKLSK